jgi:hypothetical protein
VTTQGGNGSNDFFRARTQKLYCNVKETRLPVPVIAS